MAHPFTPANSPLPPGFSDWPDVELLPSDPMLGAYLALPGLTPSDVVFLAQERAIARAHLFGCACSAEALRTVGCRCHRDDDDRDEPPMYEEHSA